MTAFPKSGKKMRSRRQAQQALDRSESAKVRVRSCGQCEVREWYSVATPALAYTQRCLREAVHVHHLLIGRGDRLSAEGVKAERKLAVCQICHDDIHGTVGGKRLILVPSGPLPRWDDVYKRVRRRAA